MKGQKPLICAAAAGIIDILWLSGIIPRQLARICGTYYAENNFPKMHLECTGAEYADAFGDYMITFKSKNGKIYSCIIGPKYLPVFLGQGLFAIESDYQEHYQ